MFNQINNLRSNLFQILDEIDKDILFYNMHGNSIFYCDIISIPPEVKEKNYKEKWNRFSNLLIKSNIKRNRAAFLIQSIWRYKENKIKNQFPDLNPIFKININDLQEMELISLGKISDKLFNNITNEILGITEDESNEYFNSLS